MRRLSVIARQERAEILDPTRAISLFQQNGAFVPLKDGDGEKDSREIEAYR